MKIETKFDIGDKVFVVMDSHKDPRIVCDHCSSHYYPSDYNPKIIEWETSLEEGEVIEISIGTIYEKDSCEHSYDVSYMVKLKKGVSEFCENQLSNTTEDAWEKYRKIKEDFKK